MLSSSGHGRSPTNDRQRACRALERKTMPSRQHSTVLYIEDNAANRQLVEMIIARRPGITLLTAENGASGLAIAGERQPGLTRLDLSLPDMDGFEILARLKADPRTASIPVFALTGSPLTRQSPDNPTFEGILAKPLDIHKFYDVIDHYLKA
jgi:CheY-like chemotaxis protein